MSVQITVQGQPFEILDSNELSIVNNRTKTTDDWLLNTFFPSKVSFPNKDAVPLDELDTAQPLAPFVSPLAQGKPITSQGEFSRGYVKAPYLKPADVVTPDTVYESALLGQLQQNGIIGRGVLSAGEQLIIAQVSKFNRLRQSINNRKILMASEILTTGKMVAVGDDHPSLLIDFGRKAGLTFNPAIKWDEVGATPVSDIETMIGNLVDIGGQAPRMALMSSKVFNAMNKSAEFKERLQKPLGSTAPDIFAPRFTRNDIPQYRGDFDGIEFWTYDVTHKLTGMGQRFIPQTGFYLISDTGGYQAQCMIKHLEGYGQALEYFDYQVIERDPSTIKLLCESSPLIVPSNPNGVTGGDKFIS